MMIGRAKQWRQQHTDETSRRHKSLVNLVMSIVGEDDQLQTICINSAIISKDGTAVEQARAIIGQFTESAKMLDRWRETTLELFGERDNCDNLLKMIPAVSTLCVSRMLETMMSTDTCNTAQLLHHHFQQQVFGVCQEMGIPEDKLVMYSGFCFQHMRNIICNGVEL